MDIPRSTPLPARENRLRITEIYLSVQGESTHVGKPCVFVRLTGCNLRCTWCDSVFTFKGGAWRTVDEVVEEVHALGVRTVEVTGGEPLLQPGAVTLMERLLALGHEILLETGGSLSIERVPPGVHVILDFKAPGSGEVDRNLWDNVALLEPHHEVKLVLASREDYEWAREIVRSHGLPARCTVLLSPAWGLLDPKSLVSWMLEDRLDARLQLQLHKVVWDPAERGV